MTREECKKIIMIIESTFPNFKAENPLETLNAWHIFLADYSYIETMAALKNYISASNSAFAPSVSQIIAMINKPKQLAQITEVEAWREVRKAISRGIYYHEEEFNKLSPISKKMVGEPAQLREWAMLPSEDIDTVIQSNFKKRFETIQRRENELAAISQPMIEDGSRFREIPVVANGGTQEEKIDANRIRKSL